MLNRNRILLFKHLPDAKNAALNKTENIEDLTRHTRKTVI